MYIFTEYIEDELHFYLMQLKQMWTAEKFFLMGKESPYSKIGMKDAQTMMFTGSS